MRHAKRVRDHARVVDSSDDAVRVSSRAPPFFIGGDRGGIILSVGRSEAGVDGSEGVHFWSRVLRCWKGVNGVWDPEEKASPRNTGGFIDDEDLKTIVLDSWCSRTGLRIAHAPRHLVGTQLLSEQAKNRTQDAYSCHPLPTTWSPRQRKV